MKIDIQHGAMNEFISDAKLMAPSEVIKGQTKQMEVELNGRDINKKIQLNFINPINTNALCYWFSDLNYDAANGIISGYFNYSLSVKDLYTCKIVFGN